MIKKTIGLLALSALLLSVSCQERVKGKATMDFAEQEFNFGDIHADSVVKHSFKFTNNGDVPLRITSAHGSCGCTVPNPPKEPIAPGQEGELLVSFNSRGKHDKIKKSVTINANTATGKEVIYITGNVLPGAGDTQKQNTKKH